MQNAASNVKFEAIEKLTKSVVKSDEIYRM